MRNILSTIYVGPPHLNQVVRYILHVLIELPTHISYYGCIQNHYNEFFVRVTYQTGVGFQLLSSSSPLIIWTLWSSALALLHPITVYMTVSVVALLLLLFLLLCFFSFSFFFFLGGGEVQAVLEFTVTINLVSLSISLSILMSYFTMITSTDMFMSMAIPFELHI